MFCDMFDEVKYSLYFVGMQADDLCDYPQSGQVEHFDIFLM